MPSSQKLALNCNSSKLERDIYGAVPNFHPLYFGLELQLRGNFW